MYLFRVLVSKGIALYLYKQDKDDKCKVRVNLMYLFINKYIK